MIVKCSNGHWYDSSVSKECPHCKQKSQSLGIYLNEIEEDDKTISLMEADETFVSELEMITGKRNNIAFTKTKNGQNDVTIQEDDDQTLAFGIWGMKNNPPVVGWLVVVSGKERGIDYRLHAGRNFIGRSISMDVLLAEDRKVAREKHGSVIYEFKSNTFYVMGEGGNLVYLNGKLLKSAEKLKDGDIIKVGETKLAFVPFCKEGRIWEE